MALFDIFKKKKEQAEDKAITLDKLDSHIKEEIKNLSEKSESLKRDLKAINTDFSSQLKEKLPSLKLINLDKKREHEKLKEVVTENLALYIAHLEKLSEDLDNLQKESKEAKKYLDEMQSIFNAFSRNSAASFEKATILIGKELEEVKEIIKEFVKKFNDKIQSNNYIFEKLGLIGDLQNTLKDLEESQKILNHSENSIKSINEKILELEKNHKETEKELEDFKKSKEYLGFLEEQNILNAENKTLNEDIFKLKQKIDFRLLLKHFHTNPKKSKAILNYSDNFQDSLKNDNNLEIISLLREANQFLDEHKIKQIQQNLLKQKTNLENKTFNHLENKLKKLNYELSNEKIELEKEVEKNKRFNEKTKEYLLQIKQKVRKIWSNIYLDN